HFVRPSGEGLARTAGRSVAQGIFIFNEDLYKYAYHLIDKQGRRPDLIAYFNWISFRAAWGLGEAFGIPVIGRISLLHEPTERYWGDVPDPQIVEEEAALFRKSCHMITVSRSMKNLIQQVHDFPDAGLHLVHNGLNPEPFLRAPASNAKTSKLSGLAAPDGQK